MTPTLRTARLVLTPLEAADGDALHVAFGDEETMRHWHMPATASIEESRERTKIHLTPGLFAIRATEGGDALGFTGFGGGVQIHHQSAFGYLLRRDMWGQGYVCEASRAVLDYGFNTLGVLAAELWIYDGNEASRRVAEKLGAVYRGANVGFNLLRGVRLTHVYEIRRPGAVLPPEIVRAVPVLRVGDLAAAVAWYRDTLGFVLEWQSPLSASLLSSGWLPNAATIRLTPGEPRPSRVVFAVPDRIDEVAATAGATAEDFPWGMREFSITDPWGNELVFESPVSR